MFPSTSRRLASLAVFALLALGSAAPALAGSGGPDGFGYTWRDINDPRGCPVQPDPFDLPTSGSWLNSKIGPVPLGFSFPFYDRMVSEVWFHQAGLVCFQEPPATALIQNEAIPNRGDGVAGFVAAHWSFLVNAVPNVTWQSFPAQGYFKASFNYQRPQSGTLPLQYEVYLYRSGDIRIEYLAPSNATTVTIGMEGFAESNAQSLRIRYDATQYGGLTYGTPSPFTICIDRPSNLACAAPLPISCGTPVNGTSPGTIPSNVTTWGCGTGTWAGKERVYRLDVAELSDLTFSLTGTGARTMAAFLLSGCNEYDCVAGGSSSFQALAVPPGTYFVAVDAASAGDEGAFQLSVACGSLSGPIACGETLADSTVGAVNRLDGWPCLTGDYGGGEDFYSIDFAPPGNLNVTVTGGTGRAAFILDPAQPLTPAACLTGGVGGAVLFGPPAGTYLIAVDGPAGAESAYTISLSCDPELACGGATALACQTRVDGTTIGQAPRADFYRCTTDLYSGPEAAYTFTLASTEVVSFVLDSTDPRMDVALLQTCNEGDCLAIGDDSVSKELGPGTYVVVVDGREGASGDFTLTTICGFGLEPAVLSVTGAEGECFTEHKMAWLTPEIVQADVFFTIDLTGSMGGVRERLQENMNDIIDRVQGFIQDVAFGLASYKDYNGTFTTAAPCAYTAGYGGGGDYPWRLHEPITTNRTRIEAGVAGLPIASGGGDGPESYNRALYESLADPGVGWRPGSRRIVVDFGDEMPHDCNVLECFGETTGSRGIDPGRDGAVGTADDLRMMEIIQSYVDQDVVLLHLTNSGGAVDGHSYAEIWDCWARRTGGEGGQLNADGTVPGGLDLAQLVADLIRAQGTTCTSLRLEAEPGFEDWVASVTPPDYAGIGLPAFVEFDIRFCVPPGTAPGTYDFEVRLLCRDEVVTTQRVSVEVVRTCAASVVRPPDDATICLGETARLDASGMNVVNCAGSPAWTWRDSSGAVVATSAIADVAPAATETYEVEVSCDADPTCATTASATVTVDRRPVMGAGAASDLADCSLGVEVSWDAVAFPSGSGSYAVYRSETSCADALTRPPVSDAGHPATSFIDASTRHGRSYFYVVVAEDDQAAAACRPPGPSRGGIVSEVPLCLPPVTEVDTPGFPALMGWALRVRHAGDVVTLDVTRSRALLPGEHFHVLKGTDPSVLSQVGAEGDVSGIHVETDVSSRLQFFDVRIANSCEEMSADDEPPGWDR